MRTIGPTEPVYVIAECGSGHDGNYARAIDLIEKAARYGADAAKFQLFRVDAFHIARPNAERLRQYELPVRWLEPLAKACEMRGLDFLCTAFDLASLDAVDPFVAAHKIGSYEAASLSFTEAVLAKGKPVLVSNGVAESYASDAIKLECVSEYPAAPAAYAEKLARHYRDYPSPPWGLSDHTREPTTLPMLAATLGASVIEKHLRLADDDWTPDAPTAIAPAEFGDMVRAVRFAERLRA